jgi:hypothetical protein
MALLVAGVVATLAYALSTFGVRPLDGVEGEIAFEAMRLRQGLPLYIDPVEGAHDYGPVAARYLVLYPPVYAALAALVPEHLAPYVLRGIGTLSWFGILAAVAVRARPGCREAARVFALYFAAIFALALFGASARPDAVAVALAGAALLRAVRRGHVDPASAGMLALAPFFKPNVLGIAAGALFVDAARRRKGALPSLVAFAVVAASVLASLWVASGGAFFDHLLAATGQSTSWALWLEQMASRAPFFAAPIGVAVALGIRARRDPGASLAVGALVASTGWAILSLAKIGSATNYWMEPSVAALVTVAHASVAHASVAHPSGVRTSETAEDRARTTTPVAPPGVSARLATSGGRPAMWLWGLVLAQAVWTLTATFRSVPRAITEAGARRATLDRVRAELSGSDVAIADEPGLELELNGRIVSTPFQFTHLSRRPNRSPAAARGSGARTWAGLGPWLTDLTAPDVRWLVLQDDLLERPLDAVSAAHDRFGVEARAALTLAFERAPELERAEAGYYVYRRRGAARTEARSNSW